MKENTFHHPKQLQWSKFGEAYHANGVQAFYPDSGIAFHANGKQAYLPESGNIYCENGKAAYFPESGTAFYPSGEVALNDFTGIAYHENGRIAYHPKSKKFFDATAKVMETESFSITIGIGFVLQLIPEIELQLYGVKVSL